MSFGDSVWDRDGRSEMSKNQFMFLYMFWTAAGLALTAFCSGVSQNWQLTWPILIGVLVAGLVGVTVALASEKPIISLLGYGLVAGPFGLMLGPVVNLYTEASVLKVLVVTLMVVAVFGIIGATIPDSLEGWGGPGQSH